MRQGRLPRGIEPQGGEFHCLEAGWPLAAWLFEQTDQVRRLQGTFLDCAGLGPIETPFYVLHQQDGLRVRAYGAATQNGPAMLLVPAPIKRCYIWDMAPHVSVVRRCLQQGMRVYLAEWIPLENYRQKSGLDDYADRFLSVCLDVIESDTRQQRILLAAHSLGGTFAAIFSCLYPERVRGLVLLETPLCFPENAGAFAPLVAATPDAASIARMFGSGHVPGSFLDLVSSVAAPGEFQWQRYGDLLACAADWQALATHMQVERWLLDEFPLPDKLFDEIIGFLYREDRLMQGRLRIGGKLVLPGNLSDPLLSVVDPHSRVAPPQSIIPFHQAAVGSPKRMLTYEGDIGVAIQHVGVLVGNNAHAHLWPAIFRWLASV